MVSRRQEHNRKLGQDRQGVERADGSVRIDPERALEVRDRCFLLLFVFKRVVYADY